MDSRLAPMCLARVGQAFQPAGSQDFLVLCSWTGDWKVALTGRLESLPYVDAQASKTGIPALRIRVDLRSPRGLSAMPSSAGFQPAVSECFQPASRTIPTVPGSTRTAGRLEIGETAGWKPALLGLAR